MNYYRDKVVKLAQKWVGKNEKDGSFKEIIDAYNSAEPLPRNIKMSYDWEWCACTWSAIAKVLKYTAIMPIEISCGFLIEEAKKMGIWKENDGYIPSPGDAILYDWQDSGTGDNTGWPDHVGIVETVNAKSGYFTVIEGNNGEAVKKRTVSINGRYIRGFIAPKYTADKEPVESTEAKPTETTKKSINTIAHEVIAGQWGSGDARKKALKKAGYDYDKVQTKVNEILNTTSYEKTENKENLKAIETTCHADKLNEKLSGNYTTTADVYCRNDAGTNKKALCVVPKGTVVNNYGYYTKSNGVKWLLVKFKIGTVSYTGFISEIYLKKI